MNNLGDVFASTFEKVKGMVETNSVVGTPIITPDGTTLIPITKVSIGVAGAGSDNNAKETKTTFAVGTGAGITMTPTAFIVINNGNVRVVYVDQKNGLGAVDRLIDMVPQTVDKITNFIENRSSKEVKAEKVEQSEN